ncbi:ABC transporter substrate-binding protein [Candidatus Peregrinibacteria bacterium]|nr:ABC transporter substrate-binding protein [Candidatus Peregrinibacteria bacterium]
MRITSLSPAVTEILFALKKQDEIVCTDQFSNFPEEAKRLPHVKDHAKVKAEELRAFNPEVIFLSTVVQERLATELRAQGFAVIHQDPRTIHQIYESIRAVGAIVDAEKEANDLILKMQQGFNAVKKKSSILRSSRLQSAAPKLYIEEWHDPPFASGNWVPEIARIAGGEQFPISAGELSKEVTLDAVMKFDPDLIVISWCGAGTLAPKDLLLKRSGWDQVRSIKEGRVRVIDDSLLNRPGPRLTEGAQRLYGWMFEMLHGM